MATKRFLFLLCVVVCLLFSCKSGRAQLATADWTNEGKQIEGLSVDWAKYYVIATSGNAGTFKVSLCRTQWQIVPGVLAPIKTYATVQSEVFFSNGNGVWWEFNMEFSQNNPPANTNWNLALVLYEHREGEWEQIQVCEEWSEDCGNGLPKQ